MLKPNPVQPRRTSNQLEQLLTAKIFDAPHFYVAKILARTLKQLLGIIQASPSKKTQLHVIFANHEIAKWPVGLECGNAPQIDSLF